MYEKLAQFLNRKDYVLSNRLIDGGIKCEYWISPTKSDICLLFFSDTIKIFGIDKKLTKEAKLACT